jgi:SAM-dependent methyltransferase
MTTSDPAPYQDRPRAESFGGVAADYDRYRPTYPALLLDDLAALAGPGGRVLDIGCGTGKAAVALASRGLDVLGVEIDARMAEVARGHGLDVEVASFEAWSPDGRRFDLVTSAQAWHWVDPAVGLPKAAHVLQPGGRLAFFWNFDRLEDRAQQALDEVYRRHAPELVKSAAGGPRHGDQVDLDELRATGRFGEVQERTYHWEHTYPAAHWLGMVQTHSDHVRLDPSRRAELVAALAVAIDGLGGSVTSLGGTYLLLARTPSVAG